jgi:hypothetical protein
MRPLGHDVYRPVARYRAAVRPGRAFRLHGLRPPRRRCQAAVLNRRRWAQTPKLAPQRHGGKRCNGWNRRDCETSSHSFRPKPPSQVERKPVSPRLATRRTAAPDIAGAAFFGALVALKAQFLRGGCCLMAGSPLCCLARPCQRKARQPAGPIARKYSGDETRGLKLSRISRSTPGKYGKLGVWGCVTGRGLAFQCNWRASSVRQSLLA